MAHIRALIYHQVASLKKVIKKYYRIFLWILTPQTPAAILAIFMSILLNYNFMHIYLNLGVATSLQNHFHQQQFAFWKELLLICLVKPGQ